MNSAMRDMTIWTLIMLLISATQSVNVSINNNGTTNGTKDGLKDERQVHILNNLGVVIIESEDKLLRGTEIVNIVLEFPKTFFNDLSTKHQICNHTDSKIETAEAKALLAASQEL